MAEDAPARFFVDENDLALGRSLAAARRDVVHPGHPRLAQVPLGTPDREWLPVVGGFGLVVITRDKKIRSRPVESRTCHRGRRSRLRPDECRRPEHVADADTLGSPMGRDRALPRFVPPWALARGSYEPRHPTIEDPRRHALTRSRRACTARYRHCGTSISQLEHLERCRERRHGSLANHSRDRRPRQPAWPMLTPEILT